MHVLNVNATLDAVTGGGTAERTFQMSRFLAKRGIQCTVLTTDLGWSSDRAQSLPGVSVIAFPILWKRFYLPKVSFRKTRDVVAQAGIIHLMGHWTILNAFVYWVARLLRKPYVICPAGALPTYGRSKMLKRAYNALIGRRIVRNAIRCIAVTEQERAEFTEYGVKTDQVVVIPNGIDSEVYLKGDATVFRRDYGLGDHPFILFVGRLNRIKGPDLLLSAFGEISREFPHHHIVFAGPDEGMLLELQGLAALQSIQHRVHFIGYVGGISKVSAYSAAEFVAVPSRQEAMSIVVLEAGIAGTPVLLTNQCGFDVVEQERAGFVVPASAEGLALGMRALLKDPLKSKGMGENLQRIVKERFDWHVVVERYLDLYRKLINDTDGRSNSQC